MTKRKTLAEQALEMFDRANGYNTNRARCKHFQILRDFMREKKVSHERLGLTFQERLIIDKYSS